MGKIETKQVVSPVGSPICFVSIFPSAKNEITRYDLLCLRSDLVISFLSFLISSIKISRETIKKIKDYNRKEIRSNYYVFKNKV